MSEKRNNQRPAEDTEENEILRRLRKLPLDERHALAKKIVEFLQDQIAGELLADVDLDFNTKPKRRPGSEA